MEEQVIRDLFWPWCGWKPFRQHDLFFGRVLLVLAEAICRRCGRRWMVHEHIPGMVAWTEEIEEFFGENRSRDERSESW